MPNIRKIMKKIDGKFMEAMVLFHLIDNVR